MMKTIEPVSFSDRLASMDRESASSSSRIVRDPVFLNREIRGTEDLYSYVGHALVSQPMFQHGPLTLYCGVPVKHLLAENSPSLDEYLDFVVCRGQDVITAVRAARRGPGQPSQEQLRQTFRAASLPSGLNWSIFDSRFLNNPDQAVSTLVSHINRALQTTSPQVKTTLRPIPSKLLQKLSSPHVQALTKKEAGSAKSWFPTEYGRSLGILQAFRAGKNGHVRSLLCCAEESLDTLWQTVSWGDHPIYPHAQGSQEKSSLSQRINLIEQGLPDNPAAAAAMEELVRNFAQTPITDLLQDDPERLAEFLSNFSGELTYQQAAAIVSQSKDEELRGILTNLIQRSDNSLADKPILSVIQAAGSLAKSRYLIWSGEMLLHDCDPSGKARKHSYRQWLQWALRAGGKDEKYTDSYYSILYRLVIEPFSLINLQANCSHA